MPVIDQSIVIARPAAEVFDFLTHAANLPRWDSSMLECVQLDDAPVTVGTRYRGASKILGRRVEWMTEVIEFVPGVRSKSKSIDGPLAFSVMYEVADLPGGASLRYRLAAESGLGGAFGRAMEPIVEKVQAKVVNANLQTLAGLLEQPAA
jgi:uncharacterized membrane protein